MYEQEEKDTEFNDDVNFFIPLIENEDNLRLRLVNYLTSEVLDKAMEAVKLNKISETEKIILIEKVCLWVIIFQHERELEPMVDTIQNNSDLVQSLLIIVKSSGSSFKNISDIEKVAARAITILNAARISFSGMDFSNIYIKGAYLPGAIVDGVSFRKAKLPYVNFAGAWLSRADFTGAQIPEAYLGEWPFEKLAKPLRCCCYSPNDYYIAASSQNYIYLYNAITHKKIGIFSGHIGTITSIVFSFDSRYILSASADKSIKLWNIATVKLIETYTGHKQSVTCLAFYPKNIQKSVSGSQDGTIRIWDIKRSSFKAHKEGVSCIAISLDGIYAISGGKDKKVKYWNLGKKTLLKEFSEHIEAVTCLAFNPKISQQFVSGSKDKLLKIWDINQHSSIKCLTGHTYEVLAVNYSPNGQLIVSGSADKIIHIWDSETGSCIKTLEGHTTWVTSVTFNSIGQQLVSASYNGELRFWDLRLDNYLKSTEEAHNHWVKSVTISTNNEYIISADENGKLCFWDLKGTCFKTLNEHIGSIFSVVFDNEGYYFASAGHGDCTVKIWDTQSQMCLTTFDHNASIWCIEFNPRNKDQLAFGSSDSTLYLWDHTNKNKKIAKKFQDHGYNSTVRCITFLPKDNFLISGSSDKLIRMWEIDSGMCIKVFKGHTDEIRTIAIHPQSKFLVSGSSDFTIQLWNIENAHSIKQLSKLGGWVNQVAFSPDGTKVASVSADGFFHIFDLIDINCETPLFSINENLNSISICWKKINGENMLVTGSLDKSVRFWILEEKNRTFTLRLLWASFQTILTATNTCIKNVEGLSLDNVSLLKQKGAIDVVKKVDKVPVNFTPTFNQLISPPNVKKEKIKKVFPSKSQTLPPANSKNNQLIFSNLNHIFLDTLKEEEELPNISSENIMPSTCSSEPPPGYEF